MSDFVPRQLSLGTPGRETDLQRTVLAHAFFAAVHHYLPPRHRVDIQVSDEMRWVPRQHGQT